MPASSGLLVGLLILYFVQRDRHTIDGFVLEEMITALGLVIEGAANRAKPFDVLVRIFLVFAAQDPVVLPRHELVIRVGSFVPGVKPGGPGVVV